MRRPNWGRIISPVTVLCGIAGWADKSLIDSKLFYPLSVKASIDRLRFYASQFPLVEVDSTYYGIPKPETVESWAAQTPAAFTFDVKSFSLFTNHPTRPLSLPPDIRNDLPANLREKKTLYAEHLPDEVVDECWERFRAALEPLRATGKLAAVFFQFPPWFLPSSRSLAYVEQCQERMFGFKVAVDVPEGHTTSMPSASEVTSPRLAVVRFHGRNHETWDLRGVPPNVRFRWDYSDEELGQWVPRIKEMERSAGRVHALMNNNYSNYSVKNAQQLERMLEAW